MAYVLPCILATALAVSLVIWLALPVSGAVAVGILCGLIVPRLMGGINV